MDYRKLISFGKSSYVVSLPKSWVRQHNLRKGDLIYFDEADNLLVLHPRESGQSEEEKEMTISVDNKEPIQIQRELNSAYINNYKTIILKGKEIKQKADQIHSIIQNLIALEVMEQTADKILARDFLDMRDISVANLVRKMDTMVRAMMYDGIHTFTEDNCENIAHRDKDVNRLSYLLFRVVKQGLRNQVFMQKKHSLDAVQLMNYYWIGTYLEAVADEVKRVARYMRLIEKMPEKEKREFEKIYEQVRENYESVMKAHYTHDIALAHSLANAKRPLLRTCEEFFLRNREARWVGYLTDRLKRMISAVQRLGMITYSSE